MRTITVVFQVRDSAKFEATRAEINNRFGNDQADGWHVSAMSAYDEITRLEQIEHALDQEDGIDRIREILEAAP